MYKDKDKQREANRKAQAKFKAKGITLPKETDLGNTLTTTQTAGEVIPKRVMGVIPNCQRPVPNPNPKSGKDIKMIFNAGELSRCSEMRDTVLRDIKCFEDLPEHVQRAVGPMPADTYARRVVTGKPGDADYNGVCTEAWRAERGR